ncbi:endonuclease [Pseudomonas sp. R76]|uniref:endonuclease n=1 Tax=Pseudomonas sp. R76 TaxID=1573711 RepID=UPI00135A112A|nr:endonuclease [Pseudomonas sp. R76]
MLISKRAGLAIALIAIAGPAFADAPKTFQEAKKTVYRIYAERPVEAYCGCAYTGKAVDLESCGYQPRKNAKRASRIEIEHIVPAWVIGHQRQCWQDGGRRNCTATDPLFSQAEGDLYNLVPVVGEVNGDRSNYAYGLVQGVEPQYGACAMAIDFKAKTAMPRPEMRGFLARTTLFIYDKYDLRLSSQDRRVYEAWARQYPVTVWERWRNQRVACAMGDAGNPLVGLIESCPEQVTDRQMAGS